MCIRLFSTYGADSCCQEARRDTTRIDYVELVNVATYVPLHAAIHFQTQETNSGYKFIVDNIYNGLPYRNIIFK